MGKIILPITLLFILSLSFFTISYAAQIIILYDDFEGYTDYWWYDMYWLDYNATIAKIDGVSCLNLTAYQDLNNRDGDVGLSTSQVVSRQPTYYFKNVGVELRFKLFNYSYTGDWQTFFAFWFYNHTTKDEFDIEIGAYPDVRNVTLTTHIGGGIAYRKCVWSPSNFADGNWHTIRIDWKDKANVTVDGFLIATDFNMPSSEMQFWMGVFTRSNQRFSMFVDYVRVWRNDDSTLDTPNSALSNPLVWIPLLITFVLIGLVKWWWS